MIVLGIETSCDETSAAVISDGIVKSNVISSQLVHQKYGGVVPELASRAHQRLIIQVVEEALARAGVGKEDLGGIAATYGPGLAGALLVGLNFGKALAYALHIPFIGVNHMEGHLYSNFLGEEKPSFPILSLVVSGGHTMLVYAVSEFQHKVLGQTRDDAAGEAFDKVSKMLGLGYPGGPAIDRQARQGDPKAIRFPRSFLEEDSFDFSFSGVKTAVLYYLRDHRLNAQMSTIGAGPLADVCAGFQASVVDVLVTKTMRAARAMKVRDVCMAGGVSANSELRRRLGEEARAGGFRLFYPSLEYCMDNGAMIAYVGWLRLRQGVESGMELAAVPNLELE